MFDEDNLVEVDFTLPLPYRLESLIDYFYDVENETVAGEAMLVMDLLDQHKFEEARNWYFDACHDWLENSENLQERRIAAYAKFIFLNLEDIIYETSGAV